MGAGIHELLRNAFEEGIVIKLRGTLFAALPQTAPVIGEAVKGVP
jgi:hypothetical protein